MVGRIRSRRSRSSGFLNERCMEVIVNGIFVSGSKSDLSKFIFGWSYDLGTQFFIAAR